MYRSILRPILFRQDAEKAHNTTFSLLKFSLKLPFAKGIYRSLYRKKTPHLARTLWGLEFANPVGLAAGFDKNALVGEDWKHFGFGFIELGTVTPRPQIGNPQPRLFRLPKDKAVINRMGFNNDGVKVLKERLAKMQRKDIIIGANIGKNKDTPNEQAVEDYKICFEELFDHVDYFVVNVSSPNTPGLRSLQDKGPLTHILSELQKLNQNKPNPKPLLLKIAPDLTNEQLDDVIEVVKATETDGLIATNTTISRAGLATDSKEVEAIGNGGLSGKPLTNRSLEVIRYIHRKTAGSIPLIGVGGIMHAKDAQARLDAGASLVQVYTGFVYQGPAFVKEICEGLR